MSKFRFVVHRDPWKGPFTVVYRDGRIIPGVYNCDVTGELLQPGHHVRLGFQLADDQHFHADEVEFDHSDDPPPAEALDWRRR